ncbi:MarR family transcriptional regulator [Altererythrobacter gangjinensis]|uniref:MarR family transcriptional regulator n=2 Tax=Pontixanthobacter gangjinensis TaxID=1028742 RepID=A0A6I4SJE9_9SPHN|nr:MarR family transcriptional regulator [Pontixanthobacter gangjinensis]
MIEQVRHPGKGGGPSPPIMTDLTFPYLQLIAQLIAIMESKITEPAFNKAYLGKRLQDLMDLTHVQMQLVYEARGLDIPVEGSSTLQALGPNKALSLSDLARNLAQPHQLVAQRLNKLLKRGLIEKTPDLFDKRRSEYSLTPAGLEQWELLDQIMVDAGEANQDLFDEIGVDLIAALENATTTLKACGLHERILRQPKKEAQI